MARSTEVMSFSLTKEMAADVNKLAKELDISKSQLLKEMIRVYEVFLEEQRFETLQRYGKAKARQIGVKSEKDIERLIDEARSA